ncbi:MAG: hypothetical protein KC731_41375, partial [Myxococcales bacterium]|nr:hypothetical protein [Myxococcales bacterium]
MRRRIVTVVVVLDEAAPREARLDELWSELSKPFGGAKPKPSLSERGKAAFQRLVARARKRNQDFEPPDPRRAFFFTAPDDEAARALVD